MGRIILIVLTVFIYSCGRNIETKQIDPVVETKKIILVSKPDSIITKISVIASDIEFIPLQTSANISIKAIDKIVSHGNKIYINLIDNVLCFDDRGNFLYKLYGNEKDNKVNVSAIYDFDIDTDDSSMIILAGNKIRHFTNSGSGFDYRKTIVLGKISTSKLNFVPGTKKFLLSFNIRNGYEPSLNALLNLNGDVLSQKQNYFKRFNPVKNNIWDNTIHYQFDNKLYFRERFNDTVFSIDTKTDTFTPALILDSRLSSTNSENINNPNYFMILPNVINIFEAPRYLYYSYNFNNTDYKVFYDKHEDKKYEIDPVTGVLKDDIGGGPDFDPEYYSEYKMYSWIRVSELKKYTDSYNFNIAKGQYSKRKEDLKKLANSLKETDNPVLIVVTLKN